MLRKHLLNDKIKTKIKFRISKGDIDIKDVYIAYNSKRNITFTINQQKQYFGIENFQVHEIY